MCCPIMRDIHVPRIRQDKATGHPRQRGEGEVGPPRATVRAGIALVAMSCATAMIMAASPVHAATRSDRAAVPQHSSNQANPQGVDLHGQPLTSPRTKLNATVLAASMGPLITRSEIINRAQSWADVPVPYSQNTYRDGYRTDCS